MGGWIKLHRQLTDKPIWTGSTPEQKVILITLLTMANHREKEWDWKGKRYKAEPGQFVTSLPSIAERAGKGVTIQNVRTALKRFEKYEFLTDESTKQNRLITIVNWAIYQQQENESTDELTVNQQSTNSQLTVNQQTTNSQLTANKNVRTKEGKNVKNLERLEPNAFQIFESEGFGTISSFIAEMLGSLIDDFGEDQVIQAMKETRVNGSTSLNYTKSILINQNKKRGMHNASNSRTSSGISPEESARISETNERRKRLAGNESGRNSHYSF
ncbi:DnaD domain-containing protein [Paenisporosarcina cavernae]|uniref:DnaD domain protein n=1 Tax=Paenisporosarcina cavernae TaxID=2320858 RepID=A0A385YT40_9BACL|nr:DnaD domain protein [Paenisporosarcina cavernae]AYC30025.1 DnaD domain protein [Paenisporosarcina cavernae]